MKYEIQIVSIEGNIGSGKSTLLANLKKHFNNNKNTFINIIFLKEPVDEWYKIKDETGTTILEKFYADQEKYSFPFQMMAYISRLNLLKEAVKNIKDKMNKIYEKYEDYSVKLKTIIITERSLFTDKMVFAKMLYDTGKIEFINYQIYLNWFNTFAEEFPVDKIIYIKANPEICYERVGKRHRDGEDKISLTYLALCNNYHDSMLDKSLPDCVCKNQLVLGGNIDIYENSNILDEWINSIEKFIYN
jgi:deoxyadenosine/deoxycytidine kinase